MSESAEPIKGFCLSGTKYSHSPIAGKCSASYEKGDYGTTLREFQPLAEQGGASAQFNLDLKDKVLYRIMSMPICGGISLTLIG